MRITGGHLRGRTLTGRVPAGVRPTSARVREALFSVIGQDLAGLTLLDAFGGSGLLSFEALSRGATVTTAERNRGAAKLIRSNALHLRAKIDLRVGDVRGVLASGEWDVVLMDPPYGDDPADWVAEATPAVRDCLVIEHRSGAHLPSEIGGLVLEREKRYGDSSLSVYRRRTRSGGDEVEVVP